MRFILIILFLTSAIFAQVELQKPEILIKIEVEKEHSFLEKFLASTIATGVYAGSDLIIYPIAERNGMVNEYRIFQGVLGTCEFLYLKKKYGWKCAISFGVNVYCGIPDLIYYGFHKSEFRDDNLNHLKFLPTASKRVKKEDLYSSSVIGFSFSLTLNF